MTFPIMHSYCVTEIPMAMIAPHEGQAHRNHGQTLKRLSERGGLAPCEALAVLEDREWHRMKWSVADQQLVELVTAWQTWQEKSL